MYIIEQHSRRAVTFDFSNNIIYPLISVIRRCTCAHSLLLPRPVEPSANFPCNHTSTRTRALRNSDKAHRTIPTHPPSLSRCATQNQSTSVLYIYTQVHHPAQTKYKPFISLSLFFFFLFYTNVYNSYKRRTSALVSYVTSAARMCTLYTCPPEGHATRI